MKIYDVCNDYSLELSEHTELPAGYRWLEREVTINGQYVKAKLGYDKTHNELSFFATYSEAKLDGQYI
ncbi:hypothetical protein [Endozoicomonas atrinae]|uniref:hypothetical protein n=1 Tax=Endozoicomonas atrinae TaxID=1333660 RepID=UPI003B00F855